MQRKTSEVIFVVVWVHSGVPYEVKAYRDEKKSERRASFLKRDINPDYDEVGVFEVEIGARSDDP
jgi:hypothetical protein